METSPADLIKHAIMADDHGVPVLWRQVAERIFLSANQAIGQFEQGAARAAVVEEVLRGLLSKTAAAKADRLSQMRWRLRRRRGVILPHNVLRVACAHAQVHKILADTDTPHAVGQCGFHNIVPHSAGRRVDIGAGANRVFTGDRPAVAVAVVRASRAAGHFHRHAGILAHGIEHLQ